MIYSLFSPKIKGFLGEKTVSAILSVLDSNKYTVINDLMIESNGRTSQIDHVIVSSYGIFVIETKNYKGWITGKEKSDYWTQTIYKRKEKIYNPLRQNYGHVQALKEKLKDYQDIIFIPIVVFPVKAELKVDTTSDVVYTVNLLKTIKKHTTLTISDTIKNSIIEKLSKININTKQNRKMHVLNIQKQKDIIENKLKADVCPKCGSSLVLRRGNYGSFKGCSQYPKCRFTLKQ
jgi:hypothetical protein